jgi:MoaA/NifB/PqqE/SkfB family radical SAM enzyme
MYLSRRLNRSLAPPDRVSLNVTLRCNLKCTMCTTCYDAPELTLEEIKGIIDQTADWGVQVFNPLGGEPFMRADIEDILSYAVERGFYVTVTTNGTLITERRAERIAQIPSDRLHFNISLDGDEKANDEIRSSGMWARAIQGLQRLRSADECAGNARRKILANTILHARNVDRFESILDEQAALGFDGVQILNLFRQTDDVPAEASALWFHPERLPALVALSERLAARAEQQGVVGYRIQNSPESLRRLPQYYSDALAPLEAPCWAGWKELYINADGQAIMCDGELDFLRGGFGSVRDQTLKQLWASPVLRERRAVVKQCSTPCVQDCYLRGQSDSGRDLLKDAAVMVSRRIVDRARRAVPRPPEERPTILRLELSDVCPCGWSGCTTPDHRWTHLTRNLPSDFSVADWGRYRDAGLVDFGRGFMGFDVVKRVAEDLRRERLRFSGLALRWRGEPLLHPQARDILSYLLGLIAEGELAQRLIIETDGRFLTDELAELSVSPAAQCWVLDGDRGSDADLRRARTRLSAHRHRGVQVLTAITASDGLDLERLREEPLPIRFGSRPTDRDAIWIRRAVHDHYLADQAATAALQRIARALGQPVPVMRDNRPTATTADALEPTISWDGKVTVNPRDIQLAAPKGDVIHSRLSADLYGR